MSELIRLPDGTKLRVRPLRVGDRPLIEQGLASLSPRSLQRRFLSPMPAGVPPRIVDDLARVDPATRVVLLAFDRGTDRLVAVARAVRSARDPNGPAEVAVTVCDAWQGRGVGTALMRALRRAALRAGIDRFGGYVLVDNRPAQRMVVRSGGTFDLDEPGVLHFELPLQRVA